MKTFPQKHLDDFLLLFGAALIVVGVSMWSIPAAFITAGVEMILIGVLIGAGGNRPC